ncbi:MAG: nucleoside triphosphate pyrophosphohydrolase [Deltaproteobacteria bacterium]|nr:nucleoside triphosphate pyrophosphohydrolase [Deltaproteobacteria bacterium]
MSFTDPAQALIQLIEIVARLRSPEGCPWDREQTPASLKRYLLEETYEVLEALDREEPSAIRLELGDLLLQIVFLSRLFEERGLFDIADVAEGIANKLVHRHPHVFQGTASISLEELNHQWDRIKSQEPSRSPGIHGLLCDIPSQLPALLRAQKVTEKAARVGFDWENSQGVAAKIKEETEEFVEACNHRSQTEIEHEFGDLLFSLVNLARFLNITAEDALRKAVERFQRRFEFIERALAERGRTLQESSLETMNALWEKAKQTAG